MSALWKKNNHQIRISVIHFWVYIPWASVLYCVAVATRMLCVDGYCPQVVAVSDSLQRLWKDGTC